jgi:hypothetical protein
MTNAHHCAVQAGLHGAATPAALICLLEFYGRLILAPTYECAGVIFSCVVGIALRDSVQVGI